jgi:cytochrome c553
MTSPLQRWLVGALCAFAFHLDAQAQGSWQPPTDTLAQRLAACTFCHGEQGRAGPDGYYPRLAGKPAGYVFNQLLHFQQGRRSYQPMTGLLRHLDADYLRTMAEHFAAQQVPYPPPVATALTPAQTQRARQLVFDGDAPRQLPACASCHGAQLMGALPATPGLLGLPRDYLVSQLGAWRNGLRRAHAPDCMGDIARRLAPEDIASVSAWLSSQAAPVAYTLAALQPPATPVCGGQP